jgi:hypothetical protein
MNLKGGGNTQQVTNTTALPDWVQQGAMENWQVAKVASDGLSKPYMGSLVAPMNKYQTDAFNITKYAADDAQPGLNSALRGAQQVIGYQPQQVQSQNIAANAIDPQAGVSAMSFPQGNLQQYMNPQTNYIERRALNNLDIQRQQGLAQTGSQAASSKAFGGSRHGIMEGVLNAESARAAGDISANLRGQAFDRAANLMQQDFNRGLTADQFNAGQNMQRLQSNQSADLTAAQQNQAAALKAATSNQEAGLTANQQRVLGSTAAAQAAMQQQQARLQGASAMQQSGNALQSQQDRLLMDELRKYDANRNMRLERLNIRQNALGMTPYGKTSSTVGPSQSQSSNPLLSGLGGAATGASIASALGATAGSTGSIAGAGLGGLLGLLALSEDKMKTDVVKVGKDKQSGLSLFAYRYKGDPKSYPKVVGPMASEIEKKHPEQVRKVGGKRVVNLGFGPMKRAFKAA